MDESGDVAAVQVTADARGEVKFVWSKQRILIVVVLAFLDACLYLCYSLLPPFFPLLVSARGISSFWVGLSSGLCRLSMFISCTYWGSRTSRLGPVRILHYGVLAISLCILGFAILPFVTADWLFILLTLLLRIVEGVGDGMIMTGLITIVTQEFSDRVGQVLGWLEGVASPIGSVAGPIVGGLMHESVGFWLPFVVFGSTMLISGIVSRLLLRNYQDVYPASSESESESANKPSQAAESAASAPPTDLQLISTDSAPQASVLGMMKTPVVWVVGLCLVVVSSAFGLVEVGLAIHLEEINRESNGTAFSESGKNALFFISPLCYGLLMFAVLGKCIDMFRTYRLFLLISLLLSSLSCLLLGPAPVLTSLIPQLRESGAVVISTAVSMLVSGVSFAFCLAPFVPTLLLIAINKGYPKCTATSGVASGCFGAFYCIGMFLGPTIAAPLFEYYGFEFACGIFAYAQSASVLLFALFSYIYRKWFVDTSPSSSTAAERVMLATTDL